MVVPGPRGGAMTILSALALLAAVLAVLPAQAASDDLFTVRDIKVDVTADSAAAAREAALAEGQRRALERLLLRLALAEDVANLPPLNDREIAETVHDFQVESERTSSVRYIGDLTFRFRADAVRRLLETHGIRFAAITSKPVLILPILTAGGDSRLWEDPNPWREAWAARGSTDGLVPLVVPFGDLADLSAIDAEEALAGDTDGFFTLADRYGTGDVIVAEARVAATGEGQLRLDIRATRQAGDAVQETYSDSLTGSAGESRALFASGVQRLDEMVQEAWKRANLVTFGAAQTLIATVPLGELSDWVTVRDRLAHIAIVRETEILYLMRGEGRLRLAFVGNMAQLSRALAQQDLSLTPARAAPAFDRSASGGPAFESWTLHLGPAPSDATAPEPLSAPSALSTPSGPGPSAPSTSPTPSVPPAIAN